MPTRLVCLLCLTLGSFHAFGQHALIIQSCISEGSLRRIEWKSYFTLSPEEGTVFVADSVAIIPQAGVPGLNIANDGRVILGWGATTPGGRRAGTTPDTGRTFVPLTGVQQPQQIDGGFVYLPDGRTRFVTEEPAPGSTPQRHRSRIVSWISSDGLNWTREPGIRYQPGPLDDSIASVPSVIQLVDSVWRMYFVGDWYRTNGIRTARSTDWGWTWSAESQTNILRNGDVDPHPVYLTNGRIRMYHRRSSFPSGVAFTDGDGLVFDTLRTTTLVADGSAFTGLKLDPAVIKYPNGRIACYIGAAPFIGQSDPPKIIAAWATNPVHAPEPVGDLPFSIRLDQNYPNPFNPSTTIRFSIPRGTQQAVILRVFDMLGREVATLVDAELVPGTYETTWDASHIASGVYIYRIESRGMQISKKLLILK